MDIIPEHHDSIEALSENNKEFVLSDSVFIIESWKNSETAIEEFYYAAKSGLRINAETDYDHMRSLFQLKNATPISDIPEENSNN